MNARGKNLVSLELTDEEAGLLEQLQAARGTEIAEATDGPKRAVPKRDVFRWLLLRACKERGIAPRVEEPA